MSGSKKSKSEQTGPRKPRFPELPPKYRLIFDIYLRKKTALDESSMARVSHVQVDISSPDILDCWFSLIYVAFTVRIWLKQRHPPVHLVSWGTRRRRLLVDISSRDILDCWFSFICVAFTVRIWHPPSSSRELRNKAEKMLFMLLYVLCFFHC